MTSERELEEKFCKLSYQEISRIISGLVTFSEPLKKIRKQEIFQTALYDGKENFLKRLELA